MRRGFWRARTSTVRGLANSAAAFVTDGLPPVADRSPQSAANAAGTSDRATHPAAAACADKYLYRRYGRGLVGARRWRPYNHLHSGSRRCGKNREYSAAVIS